MDARPRLRRDHSPSRRLRKRATPIAAKDATRIRERLRGTPGSTTASLPVIGYQVSSALARKAGALPSDVETDQGPPLPR